MTPGDGHGSKFPLKIEQAILLLLQTGSIETTAKSLNVGTSTLARWLKRSDFRAAYHAARREVFQNGLTRLASITAEAVDTLHTIMVDPVAKSTSKVMAAKTTLEIAVKVLAVEDLERRLAVLEGDIAEDSAA